MENDNRSVYERLDSQDQKLDSIIGILSGQQSPINKQNIGDKQQENDRQALATFIKKSDNNFICYIFSSFSNFNNTNFNCI